MGEPVPIQRNIMKEPQIPLKTNLCIWVLYSTSIFRTHIVDELGRCKSLTVQTLELTSISEESCSSFTAPDVIFVEGKGSWANIISQMNSFNLPFSETESSLVVFGDESDSAALRVALRVGASDFLSEGSKLEAIMPLLKSVAEERFMTKEMGELYSFINTKGGNGATTLAINLAVELANLYPNQVLLLDTDTQFGLVSEYMDLRPKYTLLDVIDVMPELDESSINGVVTKYDEKLHVLGFGSNDGAAAIKNSEHWQALLPILRQYYKYVILDFSRGIEPTFSGLIAPSTKVFMIIQQNYMSVKNTGHLLNSLKFDYGISKEDVEIVINRYEKNQQITKKAIEETVGSVKIHTVPNDFKIANESSNLGKPVIDYKKKSAISKAVRELGNSLIASQDSKSGWFSKLFS
ncbi:AAA family ATPase [Vibrio sp. SCSIO 43140]|uniref:AAA family ATPase n=1 Tax=Vibrio sp. SCSIO 43140 TaxID=2819100 RepID=UPI00207646AE|nr:AAA family ATPase [Vibrio sp. SCSIO 43140]USD61777.1 AAA family ATPase [Vibrio sp. SCSIO 43140]